MTYPKRWLFRWPFLVAFAALLLPLAAVAQTDIERRVDARPRGAVEISNISGSVVVRGWERTEVEVTGTLGRGVEELELQSHSGQTKIEVVLPRRGRRHGGSAHLDIRVPFGSSLEIETVSAEVTISEVTGGIEVESVSGNVEVRGTPSQVDLETVNGNIEVRGAVGRAQAETVSGNVLLRGVTGEIEASAVSGDLDIEASSLQVADVEAVSGNIDLDVSDLVSHSDLELTSHSGTVTLRLPSSASARFDVSTYSGRIDNELGPAARRVGRYTPEKSLRFTLGSGDGRVSAESFSGNIRLEKR